MGWIIDKDHTVDEADKNAKAPSNANAVGMMGPSTYKGDGSDCIHRFRMYDDDGELYYEGRSNEPECFEPLWNFGTPNAGATEIKYLQPDGRWVGI